MLTAKEKALEIYEMFYFAPDKDGYHAQSKYRAKIQSLLCVNEVINYHNSLFDKGFKDVHIALSSPVKTYLDIMNKELEYLKEVKIEIEKL